MALIDVRCANDHVSEVYRSAAEWPATPVCPTCAAPTEQIHLPPQTRWSIDPVVVYRTSDGSFRFPGDSNGPGAAKYDKLGYERVELRSAADVRRFEGQMNKKEYSRAARRVEAAQSQREQSETSRRSELRRLMPNMSRFGRAVARAAVDMNNAKPLERAREAGFHLEVFSNDRSNRGESRDERGRRRRD